MEENKVGRPETTLEEKTEIVRKLRPYLQAGLSIRKACLEANVPKSTVYDLMEKDTQFSDDIRQSQQFLSVVIASAITKKLHVIAEKLNKGVDVNRDELDFIKWFATNSNMTREEFGERKDIGIYDPEVEIQRLLGLINEATEGEESGVTE